MAGYSVKFDGLSFATVHGAGHLVPATRPAVALELLHLVDDEIANGELLHCHELLLLQLMHQERLQQHALLLIG